MAFMLHKVKTSFLHKAALFFIATFVVTITDLNAQTKQLSVSEMHQDLEYLDKHLRRWHPAYYDYTTRGQMDTLYTTLKNEIDTSKNIAAFRTIVRRAVGKVGCGHIGVSMPKGTPTRDSVFLLPLQVYCIKNRLFVRHYTANDSLLVPGDEILSINQIKSDSLLQALTEIETSDGYNFTNKLAWVEQLFAAYHLYVYGIPDQYVIEKKDKHNHVSVVRVLPKKTTSSITLYSRNLPDSTQLVIKGNGVSLYKSTLDPSAAIIDLNNFSGKKQYKTFRQIFRYVRKNNIKHLIVDLRDNGGGNVGKGNIFLSYFRDPLIFGHIFSRKPRFIALNPNFKAGFWERITPILFLGIPFQYPNRDGWNHYIPFIRKFKNHYDNDVYVITNGRTFSMAAYVASILKSKEGAIVVGEESGGSVYASRGMVGGNIRLPNSKIDVHINIYQVKYGKRKEDNGYGVMPNYEVEYSVIERMEKTDKELQVIKDLIIKNKKD
jgi:Peptidase family S41